MKFIASLAVIAAGAAAINLQADAAVETASTATAEATATAAAAVTATTEAAATTEATAEASATYDGPIVPENYQQAVHNFDLNSQFTDQECYQKQVDIYSDQIIAIEALRLEILKLTQKISQAEADADLNKQKILQNKLKIKSNSDAALHNKAKIDLLHQDALDVKQCLDRQWSEQQTLRHVLELYCHQFTYVSHLPYQCQPILSAGTMMHCAYAWPGDHGH